MEMKLLCVLICNFIFQYVMFRAYVYVYACVYVCVCVPHTPMHCHICQIQCSEEHTVCVSPPPPSINLWQPFSNSLPFVWSSIDKHISDI